ncbi:UNVERIFIED_CONTAM: hypothetical protein NCL1_28765 [Trichonephila clavipes]
MGFPEVTLMDPWVKISLKTTAVYYLLKTVAGGLYFCIEAQGLKKSKTLSELHGGGKRILKMFLVNCTMGVKGCTSCMKPPEFYCSRRVRHLIKPVQDL